ncbi:MAG: FAD:protein FMN transferase [Clostridia bacterium]|nr:FAD:protein FMN transferase [Clostridia bacterium]
MKLNKIALWGMALLMALSLSACTKNKSETRELFAMDTYMTLTAYGESADKALDDAVRLINENDARWSVTRPESEVSRLNAQKSAAVSEETKQLLGRASEMSAFTDGAFDPTVYPLVKAWGFTTGAHRVPGDEEIGGLLELVGMDKLSLSGAEASLSGGAQIDLGGIAKGYTGDMVLSLLRKAGVKSAIVNLGGNVQTLGSKPDGSAWRIGIRSPYGSSLLGTVEVRNMCVITSGAYERSFTAPDGTVYGHIISPFTGRPVQNACVSSTVVAEEGAMADALSTALFVMGPEKAAEFWKAHGGFEFLMLDDQGTLYATEGILSSFTPANGGDVKTVCEIKR